MNGSRAIRPASPTMGSKPCKNHFNVALESVTPLKKGRYSDKDCGERTHNERHQDEDNMSRSSSKKKIVSE